MTVRVAWAGHRRTVLERAAELAGLRRPRFTPEPVAAAACFVGPVAFEGTAVTHGTTAVVYDLGAGTSA